jgi:HPt (histidine-containing phosphotransfer) domain-containing protein
MAMRNGSSEAVEEIFDRTLLNDYSMQNQELAAEIVELFLVQLPSMLKALQTAANQTEWSFATHTLKGSAAAIGALRLQQLAAELEAMPFPGDDNVRLLRVQAVLAAAAEVRHAARQVYPGSG